MFPKTHQKLCAGLQASVDRPRTGKLVLVLVSLLHLMIDNPAGQSAMTDSPRPAAVAGRVVAAVGRTPLPRIRVHLVAVHSGASTSVLTDAKGTFEFSNVPLGRYWLRAEGDRFEAAYFGQQSSGAPARSVVLRPGQPVTDATIVLREFGRIAGRVVNSHGEPVERATIGVASNDLRLAQTNDLGEFRVPRLQPGRYLVWAIPPGALPSAAADEDIYGMTFAGNTTEAASANVIVVEHDAESSVGDIVLVRGTPTVVSGRVITATGEPASGAAVALAIEQTGHRSALNFARAGITASTSGEFVFPAVTEGRYKLRAKFGTQHGSSDLSVSQSPVEGVSIIVAPAVTLSGRLSMESGESRCVEPIVAALPLEALGSEREAQLAVVQADGTFILAGLLGLQQIEVRCVRNAVARIRRVSVNGREVRGEILDMSKVGPSASIQIEAAPPANRILGQVIDDRGEPGAGLVVVAVDDQDKWTTPFQYAWTTVVNDKGEFSLNGLPAGKYVAFHEPPRRIAEVKAPEYLEVVRKRATRFTVPETGDVKLSLRCY